MPEINNFFAEGLDVLENVSVFFNEVTNKIYPANNNIFWKPRKTRTIDLEVLMMEKDENSRNTRLFDVPNSTILSVIRSKVDKEANKEKTLTEQKKEYEPNTLNENLLQVVINNQVIVYNLNELKP